MGVTERASRGRTLEHFLCGVQIPARSINLKGVIELKPMIPNDERPNREQQKFIVRAINALGFNPVDKPVHLYTLDELEEIGEMYREVVSREQVG